MLNTIIDKYSTPKIATYIYSSWVTIVLIIAFKLNIFSKDFFRIGVPQPNQKDLLFMGKKITTNPEIIFIVLYSFINQLISNYTRNIIRPWMNNIVQDPKSSTIDISQADLYLISNLENIFGWLNYIIELATIFTMEFQFILPRIFASIIIENFSIAKYTKNKQFAI